jgi:hypothetical protein
MRQVTGGLISGREDMIHDSLEDPPAGGDRLGQFFGDFLIGM